MTVLNDSWSRVYLHFFDPQINRLCFPDGRRPGFIVYENLVRLILAGSFEVLTVATAHIFEDPYLFSLLTKVAPELVQRNHVLAVQSQNSIFELHSEKKEQYGHVRYEDLYKRYFRRIPLVLLDLGIGFLRPPGESGALIQPGILGRLRFVRESLALHTLRGRRMFLHNHVAQGILCNSGFL